MEGKAIQKFSRPARLSTQQAMTTSTGSFNVKYCAFVASVTGAAGSSVLIIIYANKADYCILYCQQ